MTASVVRTGTLHRTRRAIEEDLRSMGANLGTTAGADTSAISISGLAEFAKGLLELVSDLARDASFPDDEFERIRRQKMCIRDRLHASHRRPDFQLDARTLGIPDAVAWRSDVARHVLSARRSSPRPRLNLLGG